MFNETKRNKLLCEYVEWYVNLAVHFIYKCLDVLCVISL